jgi:uncharacterized glyoxalase superfamily protein PhnB
MASTVDPIPEGFNTVSIHMTVRNASDAIEFYKKAFGAEEIFRMPGPDGKSVMHSEIKIGNSCIMLNDEFPGHGISAPVTLNGTSFSVHIYVEDADAFFNRAVEAGATVVMPMAEQFWGDRYGVLTDPYGHCWSIATHIEDVTPEECGKRAQEFFAKMGEDGCKHE